MVALQNEVALTVYINIYVSARKKLLDASSARRRLILSECFLAREQEGPRKCNAHEA